MPPRSWRVRIEDILWQTIQEDLPAITPLLQKVLASAE